MPSSAVAMSLSSRYEQGRNQSSMQVAESVGNSVVTAVAGGIYHTRCFWLSQKLAYVASLGAATRWSPSPRCWSAGVLHIRNEGFWADQVLLRRILLGVSRGVVMQLDPERWKRSSSA